MKVEVTELGPVKRVILCSGAISWRLAWPHEMRPYNRTDAGGGTCHFE